MKIYCLSLSFIILFSGGLCAQIQQSAGDEDCATPDLTDEEIELLPWYGNNDTLSILLANAEELILTQESTSSARSGGEKTLRCDVESDLFIPIKFWFYQEIDNDPDMPTEIQLQAMMDELNSAYKSNGLAFRFYMLCPEFITEPDALTVSDWQSYWNLHWLANVPNAINVHVVEDLENSGGVYNSLGNFIVTERNVYNNIPEGTTTLVHEIGHFWGLSHPHRNFDKNRCRQECVARSRNFHIDWFCFKIGRICEKNGDALCDTPAEPSLSGGNVDASCRYTGGGTDNFGDAWPIENKTNYMSYTRRACRSFFSLGQRSIMMHNAVHRAFVQNIDISYVDSDKYEPDNIDVISRQLLINDQQCHSFNAIPAAYTNESICHDEVDWLRVNTNSSIIGQYDITIYEDLEFNPIVGEVIFWRTDLVGARMDEQLDPTTITEHDDRTVYSFDCGTINSNNDILIEIRRLENAEEGRSCDLSPNVVDLKKMVEPCIFRVSNPEKDDRPNHRYKDSSLFADLHR